MNRRTRLLVLTLACASCSDESGPTEPAEPLPLTAGPYALYLAGNPVTCNDIRIPQTHTVVQALSTASPSGNEWIFRPANAASGDFELRLAAGGAGAAPGAMAVTGSARGQVLHSYGATPRLPAERATFSTVQVNGEFDENDSTVIGRFNGQVVFARDNLTAFCPPGQVTFVLSRVDE
jgi:hypothetical protein